jgi:hypothetical protein
LRIASASISMKGATPVTRGAERSCVASACQSGVALLPAGR